MLLGQRPARRHRAGLVVDARSRGLVFWKRGEPCFREHPRLGSRVPGRLRVLVARATRFRATSRRPARALPPATTPSSLRVVRLHGAHSIAMRPQANLTLRKERKNMLVAGLVIAALIVGRVLARVASVEVIHEARAPREPLRRGARAGAGPAMAGRAGVAGRGAPGWGVVGMRRHRCPSAGRGCACDAGARPGTSAPQATRHPPRVRRPCRSCRIPSTSTACSRSAPCPS